MSAVLATAQERSYILPRIAVVAACGLTLLGVARTQPFLQAIWTQSGLDRLAYYAAAFWIYALAQFFVLRRFSVAFAILLVAGYTAILTGPLVVSSLACFLAASVGVGMAILAWFEVNPAEQGPFALPLVLLTGLTAYSALIGVMAHFGVNYPFVYWSLMVGGCLFLRLRFQCLSDSIAGLKDWVSGHSSIYWARSLCLFVLGAQFLMALKPEIGADGLSMHLTIAADLHHYHSWPFDVSRLSWAVMPMGGDWVTAAAYMVGDEFAAKLLPFALLIACSLLVFAICRSWLSAEPAFLLTAAFVSLPVMQLTTGSTFVENYWTAVLTASAISLVLLAQTGNIGWLRIWGMLLGAGLAAKAVTFAFLPPSLLWAAALCYQLRRRPALKKVALQSLLLLAVMGLPPYLIAFIKTGNPLFPFNNAFFRSPYFAPTDFALPQYTSGLSWSLPFEVTFHTGAFLESQNGAAGLWFLFVPLLLLGAVRWKWPPSAAWPAVLSVSFLLMTWYTVSYLRYVLPALPLILAPVSWCLSRALARESSLGKAVGAFLITVIVLIQTYFLASSGYTHKGFALNPLNFDAESTDYLRAAPARTLNAYLNVKAKGQPAVFLINGIAGFEGRPYIASWHDYSFFRRLESAATVAEIEALLQQLGVKYILAPLPECGEASPPLLRAYLERYTHERNRTHCAYIAERDGIDHSP